MCGPYLPIYKLIYYAHYNGRPCAVTTQYVYVCIHYSWCSTIDFETKTKNRLFIFILSNFWRILHTHNTKKKKTPKIELKFKFHYLSFDRDIVFTHANVV